MHEPMGIKSKKEMFVQCLAISLAAYKFLQRSGWAAYACVAPLIAGHQ